MLKELEMIRSVGEVLQVDTLYTFNRFFESLLRAQTGEPIALAEASSWSRGLARSFVSQVDGLCSGLRSIILRASSLGLLAVKGKDLEELQAADVVGRDVPGRPGFLRSFELTFRYFGEIRKLSGAPRKSDHRYAFFRAFAGARNQAVHPVLLEDLLVATRIMASSLPAIGWFLDEVSWLFGEAAKTDQASPKGLELVSAQYLKSLPGIDPQKVDEFYREVRSDLPLFGLRLVGKIGSELYEDTTRWHDLAVADLRSPDLPVFIRGLVRAFLTEAEGGIAVRRQVLKWGVEDKSIDFNPTESSMVVQERLSLEEEMYVAFRLFPKLLGRPIGQAYGGEGEASFRKMLAKRDRLTHPRSVADLEVSIDDMLDVLNARSWLVSQQFV